MPGPKRKAQVEAEDGSSAAKGATGPYQEGAIVRIFLHDFVSVMVVGRAVNMCCGVAWRWEWALVTCASERVGTAMSPHV